MQPGLIMSLVNYAFTFKLQDILLTDGIIWQHFTNFQPGNVKVERTLNMISDNPVDCAAYLVQRLDAARFWPKQETIDRLAQQVMQLESSVATLQQEVDRFKAKTTPISDIADVDVHASNGVTKIKACVAYVDLDKLSEITGKRPSHLRLPDGAEIAVKRWKDVLRESCKFALASNPGIPIPLKDPRWKKVWLFSTVKPATGISYIMEQYNGQTIFIYVNDDANNCVANALHVLEQVPKNQRKIAAAVSVADEPTNNGL